MRPSRRVLSFSTFTAGPRLPGSNISHLTSNRGLLVTSSGANTTVPIQTTNPMIVQSDRTILLEVDHPLYAEARDALAQFAELEKSPEHIHTYRLTPLSLWNAAASGLSVDSVVAALAQFSKYELPGNVIADVHNYMERYGRLKLHADGDRLVLRSTDRALLAELRHNK